MATKDRCFMEISNRDIYEKIEVLELKVSSNHSQMQASIAKLGGKVNLNFWIATTALGFTAGVAGALITYLVGL